MSATHFREVAHFRELVALEEQAAVLGMSGFAMTASHEFITARMERGGQHILRLIELGRHNEAMALMNSENWGIEVEEEKRVLSLANREGGEAQ